uniref:Uncharacterized protein n=1 Tax=Arundo donax TaxID=35708 RepID=A0A0A9FD86_ARUDO
MFQPTNTGRNRRHISFDIYLQHTQLL